MSSKSTFKVPQDLTIGEIQILAQTHVEKLDHVLRTDAASWRAGDVADVQYSYMRLRGLLNLLIGDTDKLTDKDSVGSQS